MKQKISTTLAVALIASQMQNIAYAETISNKEAIDILNGDILQNDNNNNISNLEEQAENNNDITSTEDKVNYIENTENTEIDESKKVQETEKIEVTEEVKEIDKKIETDIEEDKKTVENINTNNDQYEVTGKLELDINFSTPIKLTDLNKTNISDNLKKGNNVIGNVKL